MLIGGMFDVDVEKALHKAEEREFPIRCDENGNYKRKKMTNNGRTATTYALANGPKIPAGKKVLLPEYMCVSVVNSIEAEKIPFEVYKVKEGLEVDLEDLGRKMEELGDSAGAIYLIHYFGFPQSLQVAKKVKELSKKYRVPVIEDLTQSLLSRCSGRMGYGDYLVSSVRKWFPVTDGGIAAARNDVFWEDVPLKDAYDEAVYTQMFLSLARIWYGTKKNLEDRSYLDLEKTANSKRYFDFSPREMTGISKNILAQCDIEEAIGKRRANYSYLYKNLTGIEGLKIFGPKLDTGRDFVPFGFQVLVEDRDDFYQYLREKRIIGEIQWILPTQYYKPSEYAVYMSEHSLMLQCDQRYGIAEMEYVVSVIKKYFG